MQIFCFTCTGSCISSSPSRNRCQDRIRHARNLLRKMPVREKGEGAEGGEESLEGWEETKKGSWKGSLRLQHHSKNIWAKVSHRRSLSFFINRPVLAALSHSVIGQEQPVGSVDSRKCCREFPSVTVFLGAEDLSGTFLWPHNSHPVFFFFLSIN